MNHPLTDKMCEKIYLSTCETGVMLRLAYDKGRDDQLEQVIRYLVLRSNVDQSIRSDWKIADLRKAMRPTQGETHD